MRLALHNEGWEAARAALGLASDSELATRLGINHSQLHRVIKGKCLPGVRFIAGALTVFGIERFHTIFHVQADESAA